MTDNTENKKKSPANFQKLILGKVVRVKLNSGLEYTGKPYPYIQNIRCLSVSGRNDEYCY